MFYRTKIATITITLVSLLCVHSRLSAQDDPVIQKDFSFNKTLCFPMTNAGGLAWNEISQIKNDYMIEPGTFTIRGNFQEITRGSVLGPQTHLKTIQFVLRHLRKGKLINTVTFDLDVNSDGTIPSKQFPVAEVSVLRNDKLDIRLIPVEGFLAPLNEVKLIGKFKVKK